MPKRKRCMNFCSGKQRSRQRRLKKIQHEVRVASQEAAPKDSSHLIESDGSDPSIESVSHAAPEEHQRESIDSLMDMEGRNNEAMRLLSTLQPEGHFKLELSEEPSPPGVMEELTAVTEEEFESMAIEATDAESATRLRAAENATEKTFLDGFKDFLSDESKRKYEEIAADHNLSLGVVKCWVSSMAQEERTKKPIPQRVSAYHIFMSEYLNKHGSKQETRELRGALLKRANDEWRQIREKKTKVGPYQEKAVELRKKAAQQERTEREKNIRLRATVRKIQKLCTMLKEETGYESTFIVSNGHLTHLGGSKLGQNAFPERAKQEFVQRIGRASSTLATNFGSGAEMSKRTPSEETQKQDSGSGAEARLGIQRAEKVPDCGSGTSPKQRMRVEETKMQCGMKCAVLLERHSWINSQFEIP